MRETGIKTEEMPLGSVTAAVALKCGQILADIRKHLDNRPESTQNKSKKQNNNNKKKKNQETATSQEEQLWRAKLELLSTAYYQSIPSKAVAVIDSEELLRDRAATVDVLTQSKLLIWFVSNWIPYFYCSLAPYQSCCRSRPTSRH